MYKMGQVKAVFPQESKAYLQKKESFRRVLVFSRTRFVQTNYKLGNRAALIATRKHHVRECKASAKCIISNALFTQRADYSQYYSA